MTTAPKSPSTAVAPAAAGPSLLERLLVLAKTPAEREQAFAIAARRDQEKALRTMANELAALDWGSSVNAVARQRVVEFCMELGADPIHHVYMMAGHIYLNARFYQELLTQDPRFLRGDIEWIHADKRATDEENTRRLNLRIEHAVPDEVAGKPVLAACLVTLHFTGGFGPFTGVKWAPSNKNDPVGTEHPVLASETRAWRRAAVKALSPWFSAHKAKLVRTEEIVLTEIARERANVGTLTEGSRDPVASDGGLEPEPTVAEPEKPKLTKHEPSAICSTKGDHPLEECGYHKRPAALDKPDAD